MSRLLVCLGGLLGLLLSCSSSPSAGTCLALARQTPGRPRTEAAVRRLLIPLRGEG